MEKSQLAEFASGKLAEMGLFLVEVKLQPGKVIVYIDHPTEGVKLDECMALAKYLESRPELEETFQRNELEVSSPGLDEPLKVTPQYLKRQGNRVSVLTFDGMKREGILAAVESDGISLEETREKRVNGKKELQTTMHRLSFDQIKETRPVVSIDKLLK